MPGFGYKGEMRINNTIVGGQRADSELVSQGFTPNSTSPVATCAIFDATYEERILVRIGMCETRANKLSHGAPDTIHARKNRLC